MPTVQLIDYTANALEKLLYTKNTRLAGAVSLEDIINWPYEKKIEHLGYMLDTIQSSWEFVNYTFEVKGVTRAFTHQLVRTRTGSYAQQAQRVIDARDLDVVNAIPEEDAACHQRYDDAVAVIKETYAALVDAGIPRQDARGLLPTNITTEIIVQWNLRTLHSAGLLRLCTRTQGEYQSVFRQMRDLVIGVHPWAAEFIKVHCAWYGTCAFPRFTECPIQRHTMDHKNAQRKIIHDIWLETQYEAKPLAVDGMTIIDEGNKS